MIIRPALASDTPTLAKLINMAMIDITYQFIGKEDENEANIFIESLVSNENNQYSYQNIFVIQELDQIIGHICVYDGKDLERLRKPVLDKIKFQYGNHYTAQAETKEGEMYIDTFAIDPTYRGKGLGKQLLQFAIEYYVVQQRKTLGLLVEENNATAKKLYEHLGFKVVEDIIIFGKKMEHMQIA